MAEWKEYTGSDEQISEMTLSKNGYILRRKDSVESYILTGDPKMNEMESEVTTHYLICDPHPLSDMICKQALTGMKVWIKEAAIKFIPCEFGGSEMVQCVKVTSTAKPDWNITSAEYSFTPFEE